MTKLLPCIAILMAAAAPLHAESLFTGTWKGDMKASQPSTKPSVLLLKGGTFTCSTCKPVITVPADGAFHAVKGNPYFDEMMVQVVDPMTVKRSTKKAGKVMGESTVTISADGKTMTSTFNDTSADNGVAVTGTGVNTRVAAGPAGAHAISGSWRQTTDGQVSENGMIFTMAQDGKTVKYATPTGVSYSAVIGGPAGAVAGDPGWTSAALKQPKPDTLVETDMHDGKTVAIYTMKVSPDGKTMMVDVNDVKFGTTAHYVARKQ